MIAPEAVVEVSTKVLTELTPTKLANSSATPSIKDVKVHLVKSSVCSQIEPKGDVSLPSRLQQKTVGALEAT